MNDRACVDFLQWCLPKLDLRWAGFRKVRGQVCKRITRRMAELGLPDVDAYRDYLGVHSDEWDRLDAMCRISISRFYRDRGVFDALRDPLLSVLAAGVRDRSEGSLRIWVAGCASGEEAYTISMIWRHELAERYSDLRFSITATDVDSHLLERARRGCYARGTLKELPPGWIERAFEVAEPSSDEPYRIRPAYRRPIHWGREDIRKRMPDGPFSLILCRYLVFTYFEPELQRACLERALDRLGPGGLLVLGKHEALPPGEWPLGTWDAQKRIYRHL